MRSRALYGRVLGASRRNICRLYFREHSEGQAASGGRGGGDGDGGGRDLIEVLKKLH